MSRATSPPDVPLHAHTRTTSLALRWRFPFLPPNPPLAPPPLRYIPHLDVPERGRLPASRSRTRHLQGRQTLALQPHEAPSCEQTGEFKKLRDDHSDTICKPSRQKDFDDKRKVPKPQAAVKRLIRFHYGNLGRSLTSQRRGVNEATQFARQGARHRHPPARHMPKP